MSGSSGTRVSACDAMDADAPLGARRVRCQVSDAPCPMHPVRCILSNDGAPLGDAEEGAGAHGRRLRTHEEARLAVFEWIEVGYQRTRSHDSRGSISPEACEAAARVGQAQDGCPRVVLRSRSNNTTFMDDAVIDGVPASAAAVLLRLGGLAGSHRPRGLSGGTSVAPCARRRAPSLRDRTSSTTKPPAHFRRGLSRSNRRGVWLSVADIR